MEIRDGGAPRKPGRPWRSSTKLLRVTVNRNAGAPTFDPAFYPVQINEDGKTGEDLAIITLRDPDGDVRRLID